MAVGGKITVVQTFLFSHGKYVEYNERFAQFVNTNLQNARRVRKIIQKKYVINAYSLSNNNFTYGY